MLQGR